MVRQYDPATAAARGPSAGAVALQNSVCEALKIRSAGIFNVRTVRGGTALSLHAEGRAVDFALNAGKPEELKLGDSLRDLLIKHSDDLGVQEIIWNREIWTCRTLACRPYAGVSPHTDHMHVGLNLLAARTGDSNAYPEGFKSALSSLAPK